MLASLLIVAFGLPSVPAVDFDMVIRHGRVIDGTGNPAFYADVAVKSGRIAKVGDIPSQGRVEIDATGLAVAPGFIDVHTHAENLAEAPLAENFVRMGLTTIVTGNCGSSDLEPKAFFARTVGKGVSLNVATLVGHNAVRRRAMGGDFDRLPTPAEVAKMKASIETAMSQGAVGLSTGLIYMPGTFSKTAEIVELAKVASRFGGLYVSHMRSEGLQLIEAIEELLAVAKGAQCRAQISHIKASGNASWGRSKIALEKVEAARAGGIDVTQDQYVYTASSTSLNQTIPDWAREGGSGEFKKRIEDPAVRGRIFADMKENLAKNARNDYAYAVISQCRSDRSLNGKSVPQAAKQIVGDDSLQSQMEAILKIEANGGASAVFHGMAEDDVRTYLNHPNTMIASDGGPRVIGEAVPHPRNYGNNARVLARYVRDLGVLRLEDAIRRMTSLPAQTFRLVDRGILREGMAADMVVFDAKRVQDNATFEDPQRYATGFALVLVNGVPVVRNDAHTRARPGKALRLKNRVVRAW